MYVSIADPLVDVWSRLMITCVITDPLIASFMLRPSYSPFYGDPKPTCVYVIQTNRYCLRKNPANLEYKSIKKWYFQLNFQIQHAAQKKCSHAKALRFLTHNCFSRSKPLFFIFQIASVDSPGTSNRFPAKEIHANPSLRNNALLRKLLMFDIGVIDFRLRNSIFAT